MRTRYDSQTMWLLTGLAFRSGQRLGLHREEALSELSQFDAEMRRRLWWQIALSDSSARKLCGVAASTSPVLTWDTKRPVNINDCDLRPDMKETPTDHEGATEMLFCSIRYEFGLLTNPRVTEDVPISERARVVAQLESRIEERYLKHCDESIAAHILAMNMARAAILRIKMAAYDPRQYVDKRVDLSQSENDTLFSNFLKMMEYQNSVLAMKTVQKYRWHINAIYPFEAMIFVLRQLACGKVNELASDGLIDRAWEEVGRAYDLQSRLVTERENALVVAMGSLVLKAWKKTPSGTSSGSDLLQRTAPWYIATLFAQRHQNLLNTANQPWTETTSGGTQQSPGFQNYTAWEDSRTELDQTLPPEHYPSEDDVLSWDWEYWQSLIEAQDLPGFGDDVPRTYPQS